MAITQPIDGFTTTPQRTNPATFNADTDTYHRELSIFISQIQTWTGQLNDTTTNINAQIDSITLIEDNIEEIQEDVEAINTNVNAKYEEIKEYVIPEEATLSPQAIEDKIRMSQVLNMTNSI